MQSVDGVARCFGSAVVYLLSEQWLPSIARRFDAHNVLGDVTGRAVFSSVHE